MWRKYIISHIDMVKTVKSTRADSWIALIAISLCYPSLAPELFGAPGIQVGTADAPAADVLKQIYIQVKELGPYPGDTFIRHDFFLGPADDDSYKREHIVVLIQDVDGAERMRIQVTEMKNRPEDPRIQLAGKSRTMICSISAGGGLALVRSDYSNNEIVRLAPDILRAVREKKKLLDEYKAKPIDHG